MSDFISFDLSSALATIVIFLFLINYLNDILYKPLLNFMDQREADIKQSENSINLDTTFISSNNKMINEILTDAKNKANDILKRANDDATSKRNESLSKERKILDENNKNFIIELDNQKVELNALLAKRSQEVSVLIDNLISRI